MFVEFVWYAARVEHTGFIFFFDVQHWLQDAFVTGLGPILNVQFGVAGCRFGLGKGAGTGGRGTGKGDRARARGDGGVLGHQRGRECGAGRGKTAAGGSKICFFVGCYKIDPCPFLWLQRAVRKRL